MLAALGHYKLLDWIGKGRMGELFRARDTRAGRTVAIRVVASEIAEHPERRRRFVEDARAAAALSHPNIAGLYEIGDDQGRLFLAWEFVPGDTLQTVFGSRGLSARHALEHGVQLAEALADAHSKGILHGDIRPGTIMITPTGTAKFMDVGLARWTSGGAERERVKATLAGLDAAPGEALLYMAPEELLGEPVDQRADIFSLGAVLFQMLSGRAPFAASTAKAVAVQILQSEPPPPRVINSVLPSELDALVLKMLAKKPGQRYEATVAVAAELRAAVAILDVREAAREAGPRPAQPRWSADSILLIILVALVLALAAGILFLR